MAKRNASVGKRQQLQQQRLRKAKLSRLKWIAGSIVLLAGLLVAAGWGIQDYITRQSIGEFVPSLGREHINVDDSHDAFNSDPPTSGPHASAANSGFYESPVPDENVVHNLEHGYIAISYDCDQLVDCETIKANLRRIVSQYNSRQIIAVPRQNRDAPIALTAWQRLELLDEYDETRITAFVEAWRGHAPENVP